MTDWTTPDDVPADTIDRLHRWLLQEGNPADAATPGERAVADIIRAFWPVPATTLAEELRYRADLLDNGDPDGDTPHALRTLATRAEQMEHDLAEARAERDRLQAQVQGLARRDGDRNSEVRMLTEERDEALAEVERLTAENENLRRTDNYREFRDKFLTVQKGAESNAETTDPADVKPGEAWTVKIDGVGIVPGFKSSVGWICYRLFGGTTNAIGDERITLVSRLVPAPRTITNPDELDVLPDDTIVRIDEGGDAMRKYKGKWHPTSNECCYESRHIALPATVLWEPEA